MRLGYSGTKLVIGLAIALGSLAYVLVEEALSPEHDRHANEYESGVPDGGGD